MRMTASKPGSLTFTARLTRPERATVKALGADGLLMTGRLADGKGGDNVSFASAVRVAAKGGKVHVEGELTLGNSAELWVEGTDVDPGGYLVLRHEGARSGNLQLVTHLSAYLRYFTNEIYLIVN